MGIDYSAYGLDPAAVSERAVTLNQAAAAFMAAMEVEFQLILEDDEEDRAVLSQRLEDARRKADELRKRAGLTKREVSGRRSQAIAGKRLDWARRHLELEAVARTKEADGLSSAEERQEQAALEAALEAVALLAP